MSSAVGIVYGLANLAKFIEALETFIVRCANDARPTWDVKLHVYHLHTSFATVNYPTLHLFVVFFFIIVINERNLNFLKNNINKKNLISCPHIISLRIFFSYLILIIYK